MVDWPINLEHGDIGSDAAPDVQHSSFASVPVIPFCETVVAGTAIFATRGLSYRKHLFSCICVIETNYEV
jgi:hypothetical protein